MLIKRIQSRYGAAIRDNAGNLEVMQKALWELTGNEKVTANALTGVHIP
jgi:hypothetical protein